MLLLLTPPQSREDRPAERTDSGDIERENILAVRVDNRGADGKLKRVPRKSVEEQQKIIANPEQGNGGKTTKRKTEGKGKRRAPRHSKRPEGQRNKILGGRVAKKLNDEQEDSVRKAAGPHQLEFDHLQDVQVGANDMNQDDLSLDAALRRRLDWTPTGDSKKGATRSDEGDISPAPKGRTFGDLILDYGFNGNSDISQDVSRPRKTNNDGPTKKRRIEVC
jgi:hypothetical protein